jgi:hypothetical protein
MYEESHADGVSHPSAAQSNCQIGETLTVQRLASMSRRAATAHVS